MSRLFVLLALSLPQLCRAAACCLGNGPKSFISLSQLEDSEVGISTAFRDVYARYNPYGELEETERNQTYSVALGAGKRLLSDLTAAVIVPMVYQTTGPLKNVSARSGLGDVLVSTQLYAYRGLFQDDWWPSVFFSGGVKVPTGVEETFTAGRYQPGTGNGLWEPFVGLGFEKEWRRWRFSVLGNYAFHLRRSGHTDGDRVNVAESVTYVFHRRFSVGLGVGEEWVASTELEGAIVADSEGRALEAFVSPTYFLTPVFSVSATALVSLPMEGWGANHQAARSFAFTTRYGFF